MKNIIYILVGIIICSCNEHVKNNKVSEAEEYSNASTEVRNEIKLSKNNSNNSSNSQLHDLFEKGKDLLESSDAETKDVTQMDMSKILDLMEASGVSREGMEQLINNPDSLKVLAQRAIDNRESERYEKEINASKGKLSKAELSSKSTPTGVSLEEAILLVQAESGPEATMAKLKKIDSLAGTNVMEQMDLTEAGYLMSDIERKNELKASPEEEQKMKALRKRSGQMHSDKESEQLLAELEKMETDIASGVIKVSPKYKRTIEHQKKTVRIFHNDFVRKANTAKKKFKQLNPDLYFGDEVGVTYIGHMRKAVYLPLGKLSFADEVVKVDHPKLMTQNVKDVLGEPDIIQGFLPEDVTGVYSLGLSGDLTIRFEDNALTNVNGPDLYIFEIGKIEPTDLEISKDGKNWIKVGKIDGGVAQVDIEKFVNQGDLFYYVRLKDLKTYSALPGADVDAIAAIGAAMRLSLDSKVLFDSGKSVLKPEGKEALVELANSIQVLKRGNVIVEGHTDDVGSNDTNRKLSLARAKSVSTELKKLIPTSNFKWREKGMGESNPLVENDSDINRSKNRRVEILVVPN